MWWHGIYDQVNWALFRWTATKFHSEPKAQTAHPHGPPMASIAKQRRLFLLGGCALVLLRIRFGSGVYWFTGTRMQVWLSKSGTAKIDAGLTEHVRIYSLGIAHTHTLEIQSYLCYPVSPCIKNCVPYIWRIFQIAETSNCKNPYILLALSAVKRRKKHESGLPRTVVLHPSLTNSVGRPNVFFGDFTPSG